MEWGTQKLLSQGKLLNILNMRNIQALKENLDNLTGEKEEVESLLEEIRMRCGDVNGHFYDLSLLTLEELTDLHFLLLRIKKLLVLSKEIKILQDSFFTLKD